MIDMLNMTYTAKGGHHMTNSHMPDAQQDKSILTRTILSLWWVMESQWWVVFEHTDGLVKSIRAGSPTGLLVLIWAPVMCFPQWVIAPLFGLHLETLAIFVARMVAMCIVRKLDGIMPLTRALGLCHLLTFGPVLTMLLLSDITINDGAMMYYFIQSQIIVISLCLILDARDFLFYLARHPFPCYVREAVRGGNIQLEDPKAHRNVTWRSRLVGP